MHNQPTQQEDAEQSQETAYVKPSEHEGKFGIGDKMTFYVDGKPIEAEVVQAEDVDGVVVQTSERVNGHLINQYTREELDALTAPPQQSNDNADVAGPQVAEAGTEVQNETGEEEKSPDELPAFDGDKFNETHPVDEIRPQEEQKPNEENNAVDEATASKIPQDEGGEYDYMQAEPSKAWAALLEQTDGDADMAREVAQSMLDDKVDELEEAQKQQPKEGKSVAEKIAARKEHKANIERIGKEIERWQQILSQSEQQPTTEETKPKEETPSNHIADVSKKEEETTQQENIKLSDEVDENGRQFVLNSEGNLAFGEITEDTGLTAAPILLSEGMITNRATNDGYGLAHIEARHGEEIRKAGYKSVLDFIEQVAKNYDVIKEGNMRDGRPTYRLMLTDKHNNTLMVELSGDGTYWNINTAGIFKTSYGRRNREVYNRHTTVKQSVETTETSQDAEQSDTQAPSRMNVPTTSESEDTKSKAEGQEKSEESKEKEEKPLSEQISTASAEVNTNPTEAQKEAGNFKKGHVQVGTFDITIEQPQGSIRRGTDANGKHWESKMHNTYGYFRGTEGVDGDHIDVFLSNDIDGWNGRKVFVVDQYNPDGTFDEHKVMLGFNDVDEAKSDYLANYEKGWENGRRIDVTPVSLEDFEKWIESSKRKTKPFSEYKNVKSESADIPKKPTTKKGEESKADGASAKSADEQADFVVSRVKDFDNGKREETGAEEAMKKESGLSFGNGKAKRSVKLRDFIPDRRSEQQQLRGIHYDNGMAVVSDGYRLVAIRTEYPAEYEGRTLMPNGREAKGRFPNWRVVPNVGIEIGTDWLNRVLGLQLEESDNRLVSFGGKRRATGVMVGELLRLARLAEKISNPRLFYAQDRLLLTGDGVVCLQMLHNGIENEDVSLRDFLDGNVPSLHKAGESNGELTKAEVALRDAVIDRLRENGIDVVTDVSEGQRVLDMANGNGEETRLMSVDERKERIEQINKISPERVEDKPTTRKEARSAYAELKPVEKDGATVEFYNSAFGKAWHGEDCLFGKIIPKIREIFKSSVLAYSETDNLGGKLKPDGTIHKKHPNIKAFHNYVGKVIIGNKPYYVRFTVQEGTDAKQGTHNFFVSDISLYNNTVRNVTTDTNNTLGNTNTDGIVDAKLKNFFETSDGDGQKFSYHRVYHGSGADFEAFDHSHMGEGEGAQAYGWGTYVTEVEGIGRTYAISNTTKRNDALRALEHDIDAISGQLDMHRNGLKNDEEQLKRANDWRAEAELDYELFQEKAEERKKEYGEDSPEYRNLLFNDIYTDEMKRAQRSVESTEDSIRYRKEKIAELEKALNDKKAEMNELPEKFPRHLYSVEIPDDNGKNYLDWNERLSDSQIEAIRAYLSENYRRNKLEDFDASIAESKGAPNADEVNAWARRGENVYKMLSHLLGSDDAASKALSEMGFTGIKYPAENRSGGRKDGARNYVIFNEGDAKIVDKVRFFKTANGEAYGFVVGGKIYIDPRIASSETSVHEYAHLWAEALRSANAKEWSNVVGLMRGTSVWNEVSERYPELKSDDEIADEVLATYSGRRGSERLREEMDRIKGSERSVSDKARALGALERVKRALDRFWHGVADFLGIHYKSADEVADRVMKDLLNGVDPRRFVKGESDGRVREQFVGEMGAERAVELGRELGSDVDVVSDVSEITDPNPEVQERKRRAKGWYDAKTGRVVINLAAHSDMADVEQTLLHEIVGHRGLRGLVGHENFNGFLDGIYEHASDVVREGIDDIARRKGCSKRVATEEYMSGLAEGGFADRKNAGLWQQIRQWFGDMLSRAKIKLNFSISDNELRYLLWRSHELSRMNGREGVVGRARDLAMQNRLGVGNGVDLFRTSKQLDAEYGSRWIDEQTNADGRHTTQVKNTVNSYKKFGEWVQQQANGKKVDVLDASSGLGVGTEWLREHGMNVDDVEPYPSENRTAPTYSSYEDIDKRYDYIISNAVLNVIPEDWRADVLHSMADKLKVGGKLVINVRGAESIRNQGTEGQTRITLDDPSEILVLRPNGTIKAYQKGFTKAELKGWCEKELGDGYSVEVANSKNAGGSYDTAVVVTKNDESNTIGVASGATHPSRIVQEVRQPYEDTQDFAQFDSKIKKKSEYVEGLLQLSSKIEQKKFGAHEFLYSIAKAFGFKGNNFNHSMYQDLGGSVGIRISDHSANAENFSERGSTGENYGLVVKLSPHRFRSSENVDYLEYTYYPDKLTQERQKEIVDGLKDFLQTGDYSKLPSPDRVNKSGTFEQESSVDSYDGDLETLFRDADSPVDYERALIRDSYERRLKDVWFQSREALQDGMLSLKETMKDIWRSAGKKFSQITDIPDYANPYIGQNRLSSRNAAEVRDFKHNLFRPLLREVGRLTGFSADGRAKLTDYMMAERVAKHPNSLTCGP